MTFWLFVTIFPCLINELNRMNVYVNSKRMSSSISKSRMPSIYGRKGIIIPSICFICSAVINSELSPTSLTILKDLLMISWTGVGFCSYLSMWWQKMVSPSSRGAECTLKKGMLYLNVIRNTLAGDSKNLIVLGTAGSIPLSSCCRWRLCRGQRANRFIGYSASRRIRTWNTYTRQDCLS